MSSNPDQRWLLRIAHIKKRIRMMIFAFIDGLSYEEFLENDMAIEAVIRSFQVIGDAVKKVPDDVRASYPDVPWRAMAQFRDKIVHDYEQVDLSVVWKIVKELLPAAEDEIKKIPVSEKDL